MYELIIGQIQDKNPTNDLGKTPRDYLQSHVLKKVHDLNEATDVSHYLCRSSNSWKQLLDVLKSNAFIHFTKITAATWSDNYTCFCNLAKCPIKKNTKSRWSASLSKFDNL